MVNLGMANPIPLQTSTQLANRCGSKGGAPTRTFIYGTTGKRKKSKLLLK